MADSTGRSRDGKRPANSIDLPKARHFLATILRRGTEVDKEAVRWWVAAKKEAGELSPRDVEQITMLQRFIVDARRRLLTVAELLALPPPRWIIDGLLQAGSLAVLYGLAGAGKTFVVLDLCCSIATGRSWFDREVGVPGHVVYVAAEGAGGLGKRLAAWGEAHGADLKETLRIYPEPVNLLEDEAVGLFIETVGKLNPVLIVFDTLARCMVGGDENSSRDMGRVVAHLDRIRHTTGAAVLVVHHTGKREGAGERGSTALRGAAETMLKLTGTSGGMSLVVDKQKDAEAIEPLPLRLEPAGESCVLRRSESVSAGLGGAAMLCLRLVSEAFDELGPTHTQWKEQCNEDAGVGKSVFNRALKVLVEGGFVERVGGNETTGRGARYRLTQEGREALGLTGPKSVSTDSDTHGNGSVPGSPPPLGGGPRTDSDETEPTVATVIPLSPPDQPDDQ